MTPDWKALRQLPPTRWGYRVFLFVWQVVVHLLCPLAVLHFLNRSRREPLYRKHLSHRFGFGPVAPKCAIWVFATSLGETRAASPVIRRLIEAGHDICLTHASPAGLSEGKRLFDTAQVTHRYVPFDLFWATALFFWRQRPAAGLLVEGEFWPGHLQVAEWFDIPMLHINGNLHERAIGKLNGLRRLRMKILTRCHVITTKGPAQVALYERAGVGSARILPVGELKFDQSVQEGHLTAGARLREGWAAKSRVFLIASSVVDEEPALLKTVTAVLDSVTDAKIIWAPRSPQRFDAVAEALSEADISFVRRSAALGDDLSGKIDPDAQVILGDSLGEMNVWYQMADLVFVGATLNDHGGHNISEPLSLGRPVIIGPSTYGITYSLEAAKQENAVEIVPNGGTLTARVCELLRDESALNAFQEATQGFAQAHRGAAERTHQIIDQLISAKR